MLTHVTVASLLSLFTAVACESRTRQDVWKANRIGRAALAVTFKLRGTPSGLSRVSITLSALRTERLLMLTTTCPWV